MKIQSLSEPRRPGFYDTIITSPQWEAWEKVAEERGFDYAESKECGWLSPEHWQAFIAFIKNEQ